MKVIERDLHTTNYLVNLSVSSFMVTMAVMVDIYLITIFMNFKYKCTIEFQFNIINILWLYILKI